MYSTIIIIFSIIVLGQLWYIFRLRKTIRYAVSVLLKYEAAFRADSVLKEAIEEFEKGKRDGSKDN